MSDVRVSFAVQAHPTRSLRAHALADKIGGDVVFDPNPTARRGPWRTFRRLLSETPSDATHRFQVQDDANPCPGLRDAVQAATEARPGRLLVFYVGTQQARYSAAVLDACRKDLPWAELPHGHWIPVVATCWPRHLIDGFLEFSSVYSDTHVADDEVVGTYMKKIHARALASVPSLVDHDDTVPPILGNGRPGIGRARRAACFIGDCAECVEGIDWTSGPGA